MWSTGSLGHIPGGGKSLRLLKGLGSNQWNNRNNSWSISRMLFHEWMQGCRVAQRACERRFMAAVVTRRVRIPACTSTKTNGLSARDACAGRMQIHLLIIDIFLFSTSHFFHVFHSFFQQCIPPLMSRWRTFTDKEWSGKSFRPLMTEFV